MLEKDIGVKSLNCWVKLCLAFIYELGKRKPSFTNITEDEL